MSGKALNSLFFVDIHVCTYVHTQTNATKCITLLHIRAQGIKMIVYLYIASVASSPGLISIASSPDLNFCVYVISGAHKGN